MELSEVRSGDYEPAEWSIDHHAAVIAAWTCSRPTVFVSYDHPKHRFSTVEQIDRADETLPKGDALFREILFKPEAEGDVEADVSAIIANVHRLAAFDAVGVTEKEIGQNLQARMVSIARIRKALDGAGLGTIPIHVFGSLDTISTPLYFVAGADIFDGLTWLRFAYHEGMTVYQHNSAAIRHGTEIRADLVPALCFSSNYHYMKTMRREMQSYIRNGSFDSFKYHKDFIEHPGRSVRRSKKRKAKGFRPSSPVTFPSSWPASTTVTSTSSAVASTRSWTHCRAISRTT